jgi:hypothetical protein
MCNTLKTCVLCEHPNIVLNGNFEAKFRHGCLYSQSNFCGMPQFACCVHNPPLCACTVPSVRYKDCFCILMFIHEACFWSICYSTPSIFSFTCLVECLAGFPAQRQVPTSLDREGEAFCTLGWGRRINIQWESNPLLNGHVISLRKTTNW